MVLRRFKRRWSPPPYNLLENDKGPFPKYLETVKLKIFFSNHANKFVFPGCPPPHYLTYKHLLQLLFQNQS